MDGYPPSPTEEPQTPMDFVNWLKRKRTEFAERKNGDVKFSGIVELPVAKSTKSPGPSSVIAQLGHPADGFVLKEQFLNFREEFCPFEKRIEWDKDSHPKEWQTIRELLQAMEIVHSFLLTSQGKAYAKNRSTDPGRKKTKPRLLDPLRKFIKENPADTPAEQFKLYHKEYKAKIKRNEMPDYNIKQFRKTRSLLGAAKKK